MRTAFLVLLGACLVIWGVLTACNRYSEGAGIFEREKCRDCHTIKGRGGAVGPNLTTVGKRRDRAFIAQQIKDPASHNPNTAMPSFKDRLSEQDINALADYLSDLR